MSPRARWLAGVAGVATYLGGLGWAGTLRGDHLWLAAAGLAAWLARGRARAIALFFAPLLITGAVYDAQRHWVEAWRGPIHVTEPLNWELAWFGIRESTGTLVTPAAWWQRHTRPWFDAVTGASYLLFIPGFVAMAAWWRWARRRPEAQDAMWAMLWLNLAGYATYLIYAAAPPWYVELHGLGPANPTVAPAAAGAARFDALFGVTWFADYYGRNANVFGAIPSLHVGQTFLAVLYAWRFRSLLLAALAFWALVTFASVYLNHHYLVDGLVGMLYAVAAFAVMAWWRRGTPAATASAAGPGLCASRPCDRRVRVSRANDPAAQPPRWKS